MAKMSKTAKLWFRNMGSGEILELGCREGFAFIGVRGEKTCFERRQKDSKDPISVT